MISPHLGGDLPLIASLVSSPSTVDLSGLSLWLIIVHDASFDDDDDDDGR